MPFFSPLAISPYNRLRAGGSGGVLFPGILDAYPDAAAAYSLRRLSNDWAKPANTNYFTFGNALDFDGANNYVSFNGITTTTTWCTSFWFQYSVGVLISTATADKVQFWSSTSIRITTGGDDNFYSVPAMSSSTWYHCFISVINGACKLYLNGTQTSSGTQNSSIDITSISNLPGGNFRFGGILDETAIWSNTSSTPQNALDLYNGGLGALASSVIPSPTAYWKMNESGGATTAIDSSGNGNNGTLVDFPQYAWQTGGGLDFDGVNDYIEFSTISLSNTSSYTISFWFKFNGSGGSFTGKPGSSMYTGTNPAGTTLYWRPSGAFYQYAIDPSVTLTNGKWSHIMFTQTANSTGDVYVDGVISTSSSTQLNVGNLSIDYIGSGANGYMNGEFGEVAIWNGTAGTGQNALDIYELGTTGDASTIISSPNRYYKLNETAGTVAADSGSDGANGTLVNFNTTSSWVVGNANKGVLVEIRRSSDNAVKAFYYDDNNELSLASEDAAGTTLSSWIGSDNGFVRTWYDQSGNANNATQTTTTTQPSIITAGVISTEQGKPAIKLIDNSLDFFTITEKDFNDLTWLTVLKQESTTPNNTNAVVFYSSGSFYGGSNVDNQGNPMLSKLLIKTSINNTSAGGGEKVQHLNYYHRTGSTTDGGLNGQVNTPAVTNSTTFPVNRLFFYSANAYYFEGTAQEIIMYDSSKSADRAGIETNINNFYRIYGGAAFSFGNALKFDGANDFVSPNTNLSNENDVSLSCWINAETTTNGYNVLLANSTGAQYFAIRIIGESKLIRFDGFGIFNSLNTSNTFIENTWFHVGVIQSGNSVSYYYNGVLEGTVAGSSKRSDIDLIGKYGGSAGGGLKFKGLLDEYVLWDSALTDTQMKNQYNLGAGNFADLDVTPLVYYSCNQVDGTTPLVNDGSGGSSYDGTLNNFATPYFVPHHQFSFGNALEFDGANDYVNTATNTFADLLYDVNGQYTLSFWVKPNSLVGAPVLFSGSTLAGKFFFELGATAGTLYWGAASGGYRTYTTVGFSVGNWNHFMITKTAVGNNANLYCNGSLESSYTGSLVDVGNVNNQLYFGQYHTGSAKLNGVLDEIAIWNGTTGTAQNALDLYNSGSGALASDVIASPTAYWRMNGSGTDTTAVDETGNYNGTLNNFPTSGMWVPHTPYAFMTATGGDVPAGTIDGDYKVHTFTATSGTFTVTSLGTDPTAGSIIDYLLIAGGGGGGGELIGAGGGAGGYLTDTGATVIATSYAIAIGAGGAGGASGNNKGINGSNSTFFSETAIGGGGGSSNTKGAGNVGGSGGGGTAAAGGAATAGQGNAGGAGVLVQPNYGQGGGGGAGGTGTAGTPNQGGAGGVGLSNSITGAAVFYAGGGGGSAYQQFAGVGGNGGGGNGSIGAGSNGDANTGGGGGGSERDSGPNAGGNGGSGILIVRYKFQ